MSLTRRALLAAAMGCGLATTAVRGGDDKKPPEPSQEIKDFVAYVGKNGVKLERDEGNNWWLVEKGDGYEVVVALRSFPAGTTEKDMRETLMTINLYHMLNARERLAMSRPGMRLTNPAKNPPKEIPAAAKLEKLFKDYAPVKG